ncbi:MAG: hypothetical protein HY370_03310 [Proteobacteria bacterium]|nr:hypothetical protein [Pseudomonadota bacterium]
MEDFNDKKAALSCHQKATALIGDPLTAAAVDKSSWQNQDEEGVDALTYLKLAVSLDPENCVYRLDLYTAFREMGNRDAAWQHLQEAFRRHPRSENARLGMVNFLCGKEKHEDAIALAKEGIKTDSQSRAMWFALGYSCLLAKRYSESLNAYLKALDLEAPSILAGHEHSDEIMSAFERAIRDGIEKASRGLAEQSIPDPFPRNP